MPRFVLLEHVWNGTHYDLMIEHGDALRTWAIDEPLPGGRELPARALPNHRLAFLDYEGPVSGGRGHVRRIDRGTFLTTRWQADRLELELQGEACRGSLDVRATQVAGPDEGGGVGWVVCFRPGNRD